HICMETSLSPECSMDPSLSWPSGNAPLKPSLQCCTHHRILVGYRKSEIRCQKVYQVSIFSHHSSSSESMEQQAASQPAIKRGYPEQQTLKGGQDLKQTPWGGGGVESKHEKGPGQPCLDNDNTFEDGLLVEELSLCSSAQHFSHSGLQVVEHHCEGSPSHSSKASREDKLQDVSSSFCHIACSTLHTKDGFRVLPGDQPTDSGDNRDWVSGHNLLYLDLHNIAQTPQLDSGGKIEKPGSSLAYSSRVNREEEWLVVANGCKEPPAPQAVLSPEPGNLSSLEKTPCGSSWLSGSSCPGKRKLMPDSEVVADSYFEDKSLFPPVRKKRALSCHPVSMACHSANAKRAPYWNHLLPMAKDSEGGWGGSRPDPLHAGTEGFSGSHRFVPDPCACRTTVRRLLIEAVEE
ncbi:atos homolog protein B-like, partial [Haemorhous mexicanus]|uniref:atos homolog protein B-like n=1 Tax=Haemorhous mexicanus TaxID=30427 RepID=UPI0028BDAAD3